MPAVNGAVVLNAVYLIINFISFSLAIKGVHLPFHTILIICIKILFSPVVV